MKILHTTCPRYMFYEFCGYLELELMCCLSISIHMLTNLVAQVQQQIMKNLKHVQPISVAFHERPPDAPTAAKYMSPA